MIPTSAWARFDFQPLAGSDGKWPAVFVPHRGRTAACAGDAQGGCGYAKAIHYLGHFPVADLRYELDVPLAVELRAYSPFLPGDAAECNTPAAVFEVRVRNAADTPQEVIIGFRAARRPS